MTSPALQGGILCESYNLTFGFSWSGFTTADTGPAFLHHADWASLFTILPGLSAPAECPAHKTLPHAPCGSDRWLPSDSRPGSAVPADPPWHVRWYAGALPPRLLPAGVSETHPIWEYKPLFPDPDSRPTWNRQ